MMLSPAEEEIDVEVRLVDQRQINEFGRLNTRKVEVRADLDAITKQIQGVVDAEDAMALSIDDGEPDMFRVLVGETFVSVSESAALEYIATRKAKLEEQAAAIRGELDHIESRQAELKASLYARFGKAINLEE